MKIIKFAIILIGAVMFLWFLAPLVMFRVLNSGNAAGMTVFAVIFAYGICLERTNDFLVRVWNTVGGRALLCCAAFAVFVTVAFASWATVEIAGAASNPASKPTTVVVLGCQVREDGPSRMLIFRLETAFEYLRENPDAVCIISGGKGEDEPVSEAECMYQWLTKKGIDPERLIKEEKSTSTRENLAFSKKIIEEKGLEKSITVITNGFHQYRASKIAQSLGMESYSISAKTPVASVPAYYTREMGGVLYELLVPGVLQRLY